MDDEEALEARMDKKIRNENKKLKDEIERLRNESDDQRSTFEKTLNEVKNKSSEGVNDALAAHSKILKDLEKKVNEGTWTSNQIKEKSDKINSESEVKTKIKMKP